MAPFSFNNLFDLGIYLSSPIILLKRLAIHENAHTPPCLKRGGNNSGNNYSRKDHDRTDNVGAARAQQFSDVEGEVEDGWVNTYQMIFISGFCCR